MKEQLLHLANTLKKQLEQLKTTHQQVRLFSGEFVGTFAGSFYYRFEIPEDVFPQTPKFLNFTFGQQQPLKLAATVIAMENQYLTVALPRDFGESIPETLCSWDHEPELNSMIELLRTIDSKSLIPFLLFNPSDDKNNHTVNYEIPATQKFQPEQIEAVKKIWRNRVTLLFGSFLSGSSQALVLAAMGYIKTGRKVLFVSPCNKTIDTMFLKITSFGEQSTLNMTTLATRVDLPSPDYFETIAPYSLANQMEIAKEEKRNNYQEQVSLLKSYWQIKIKQILNEDFYKKVQEKRDRLAELRKQTDQVSKEKTQLNQTIADLENASLIDRLKKGFSKNDLNNAHEQLTRQQQAYSRLLSIQQAIANEITEIELEAPVTAKEQMLLKETLKSIDELGGLDKVTKSVEEFITVDVQTQLQSKVFIATSINTAITDPFIRGLQFDLVIVDDAHRVNIPTLAAVATLAKDKIIVAGDPFELGPVPAAKDEQAESLLQQDIFTRVAQTTEFRQLFDWSEKNPRWSVFLKSQYATTPKLSLFLSSMLFEDVIKVFAPLQASGKIYFIDTSKIRSRCKQYAGKRRVLPFNELHTKQVLECVKHALMRPDRNAQDIGVILPFTGPTLHTKLQLRIQGIRNVEVGTPQTFCNQRKQAIIFDTTVAGVDYTLDALDDKKIGEHAISRMFNTIASCAGEDLYIIADMSHFKFLYQDRLITRILEQLQAEADEQQPLFTDAVKKFDDLSQNDRQEIVRLSSKKSKPIAPVSVKEPRKEKVDRDLEIQMKKMAREWESKLAANAGRNIERDVYVGVHRVLGWRADLNLVSQFIGGDVLFRNTSAAEKASRKLPFEICENEIHFRDAMELWNLIIYEMSGGNKVDMSFFASKGPEGRLRQDIRNLHAYYSSDVEAAIEEGKKKIAVEVARVFQELLGKNKPDNPADWSTSYLNFLTRLEAYLSWISEQIRK